MVFPGGAEADVREADGAPGEDRAQAGEGEHPGEGNALDRGGGKVSEKAEGGGEEDGDDGAAFPINVGEDLGGLALFCKSSQCARGTIDG